MEKNITHDQVQPSLKIRIRISPEMKKQLMKEEEEEAVKEIINLKSEVAVKELIEVHHHHQPKLQKSVVDCSSSFELKLEATKRKFHDSYQQIANAKRQRRIQVIDDPRYLPPQATGGGGGRGKLGTTSKLDADDGVGAKSRILNVILSKKKNKKNTNNLFSASRSKLLKPSYIF